MPFSQILLLLGYVPRVFRLLKEVWVLLSGSPEAKIKLYLEDVETITTKLRGADTNEKREEVATRISDFIRGMQ